jgi:hypothetical protein
MHSIFFTIACSLFTGHIRFGATAAVNGTRAARKLIKCRQVYLRRRKVRVARGARCAPVVCPPTRLAAMPKPTRLDWVECGQHDRRNALAPVNYPWPISRADELVPRVVGAARKGGHGAQIRAPSSGPDAALLGFAGILSRDRRPPEHCSTRRANDRQVAIPDKAVLNFPFKAASKSEDIPTPLL